MDDEDKEKEVRELERVCGRVDGFNPRTKKIGVLVIPEGLKLPETYWAWRDEATQEVVYRDGGVLNVGDTIVFDFSRNPRDGGGSYKNVEGDIERVGDLKSQPAESNLQEKEVMEAATGEVKPSETTSRPSGSQEGASGFKPADKLSLVDDIKAEVGVLQAAAIEVTNGNLETKKLTEVYQQDKQAWAALVDTVLIQMARSYDKRGQYIKKKGGEG